HTQTIPAAVAVAGNTGKERTQNRSDQSHRYGKPKRLVGQRECTSEIRGSSSNYGCIESEEQPTESGYDRAFNQRSGQFHEHALSAKTSAPKIPARGPRCGGWM